MAAAVGRVKIFLTVTFCLVSTSVQLVIGQCSPGKYGVDCQYDCHCGSGVNCDPASGCSNSTCALGWGGPTCQKENVALNRPAKQSSTGEYGLPEIPFGAEYAVDGRVGYKLFDTLCTHTEENQDTAHWSVTLSQVYEIFGFTIYNRHESTCGWFNGNCGYRLRGFILSVGNTSASNYTTCYQDQTTYGNSPGEVITRNCQNGATILGDSVKISLNTGKPLTLCEVQVFACSSGTFGADCGKYCYCWNDAPCPFKTGACPVNVGSPTCKEGYHGIQCNIACDHKWGADCTQNCGNCWNNMTCDGVTGVCPVIGENRRCSPGYFGERCLKCGHCFNNTACDMLTGVCPEGNPQKCNPGYLGEHCKQRSCPDKFYGPGCRYDCHCGPGVICDPLSGCIGGPCSPGWDGGTCQRQNVALLRAADQSSTLSLHNRRFPAKYAVDGEVGHSFDATPCTHTDENYQTAEWNVTLVEIYSIYRFRIYNRNETDCNEPCGARLNNFRLSVGNSSSYTTCYQDNTTTRIGPGNVVNKVCDRGPVWGDRVKISLDTGEPLTLCEVQLFVCAPGWYGERCEKECNTTTRCLRCDNARIQCELCVPGSWGENCGNTCGKCWDKVCLQTNGTCVQTGDNPRCQAGYNGTDCLTNCSTGSYGPDCNYTCGYCANGTSVCDVTSGHCPVRDGHPSCAAGYHGEKCDQELLKQPSDNQVGWVAGGVVGALLAVASLIIVVVVYLRRRRQKSPTESNQTDFDGDLDNRESSDDVEGIFSETDTYSYTDNSPYENSSHMTKLVSVDTFGLYLAEKISTEDLITEYESFKSGLCSKHDAADRSENQEKSRYRSLLAYDHSRVILKTMPEPASTDYINASYINGYNQPKKYIASQGPTKVMINDFMLMIWEQDVGKVVMLTNLVEKTQQKCLQYWPNGESSRFGVVEVTSVHVQAYADFIIRTLELTHSLEKNVSKVVKQFHFTSWPDHGVPTHPTGLLDFRDKVNSCSTPLTGPIAVHCSAGIGRTGTYIALDYLMNQAKQTGKVDVPLCVNLLREQRVNMVQTQEQYDFLHHALLEALQLSHSCIPCVEFSAVYHDLCSNYRHSKETKLKAQFRVLGELTPDLTESSVATAKHPDNQAKNRFPNILAADSSRPFLTTYVLGRTDYINAVFLPSYKMKRAFLITQMPLPNTIVDFWRLVYEQSVSAIVMLDTEDNTGKNDGIHWPNKSGQFGPFIVEEVKVIDHADFSVTTYELTYKNAKCEVPVKQFRCKFWPRKSPPESTRALLALIEYVEHWRKDSGNKPVIVHCRDGVSKSGVYCAASAIMERLVEDKDVNIVQMIKQLRIHRPQIITDLEQFDFLHRVVIEYLNNFQTYSNFM